MFEDIKIVDKQRMALTKPELDILQKLAAAGDRAGFYIAYYGMTGNKEALLTAKIATFSEDVGGTAYAANWLLNDRYKTASTVAGEAPYAGIYWISQRIVDQSYQSILHDLGLEDDGEQEGLPKDGKPAKEEMGTATI